MNVMMCAALILDPRVGLALALIVVAIRKGRSAARRRNHLPVFTASLQPFSIDGRVHRSYPHNNDSFSLCRLLPRGVRAGHLRVSVLFRVL
jgi:hypothetical protein